MTESTRKSLPDNGGADSDPRTAIQRSLAAGSPHAAMWLARQLLQEQPSLANFRFIRKLIEGFPQRESDFKLFKVALLSSFSIEFVHDSLIAFGFVNGLRIEIYQPGFALIRQEMLDSTSGLYAYAPDATILAIEGEDWLPEIYTNVLDSDSSDESLDGAIERFGQEINSLARAFRSSSLKTLLVHNLAQPRVRRAGIADLRLPRGQGRLVAKLNQALGEALANVPDAHVVDYAELVNHFGVQHWYDSRMRLYAKAPISNAMLGNLSQHYLRYFRAVTGFSKKCLVVDLDNTLWGGVVGEDGIDGIQLGPDYPGIAFFEFQRSILDLYRRGVILAVASKNNLDDVEAVFLNHRSMLLRKEHFSAWEVHWERKSESLKRIAKHLDIGLEHMVFTDDNPAECEQIRRELPMVTVIQLPRGPEKYVDALFAAGLFDTVGLSAEDRRRGQLYQQRAEAQSLRSEKNNIEDYYKDLDMALSIAHVDRTSLTRAAQLTQKTNQFNISTIRYSEAELNGRAADPDWLVATVSVRDRFGDNGIVGVMMARESADDFNIDTFLLSCRVIGRTVETAMLAFLCDAAKGRGLKKLCGRMVPTAKNAPVQDMFEKHGFNKRGQDEFGSNAWELDLSGGAGVERPSWFRVAS